jgi:hypothetical protein
MNAPSAFDEWYRERTLSSIIGAITPGQSVRRLLVSDLIVYQRLTDDDAIVENGFSSAPELQAPPVRSLQLGNERNDYPAWRNLSSQRNHTSNWFDVAPLWSTNLHS